MSEIDSPIRLLVNRNFFKIWFSGFLFGTTRWLDVLAVAVFVFDVTGSPFTVAMTMFLRMIPLLIIGPLAGAFAAVVDGRKLLIIGLFLLVIVYGVLWVLSWNQSLQIWQLILGVFLSGIFWAFELPIRRTMVAEIAGIKNISVAMGLDTATNNFTRILGPFFGGWLYEVSGLQGTLALGSGLYLLSVCLLLFVKYSWNASDCETSSILGNIFQAASYARSDRAILAAFLVTITFNFFGFACVAMVPVIARQELGLSAFHIGILSSVEGLGAFLGSLLVAYFVFMRRFNQVYFFGATVYLFGLLVFAISNIFWISLVALFIGGVGMAGFSSMQAAIVISNAPPQMRTRLMGLLTMCIGSGPFGVFFVGLLSIYFGAAFGVMVTTVLGLITLSVSGVIWPELLKLQTIDLGKN